MSCLVQFFKVQSKALRTALFVVAFLSGVAFGQIESGQITGKVYRPEWRQYFRERSSRPNRRRRGWNGWRRPTMKASLLSRTFRRAFMRSVFKPRGLR